MKSSYFYLLRAIGLLVLIVSLVPMGRVNALPSSDIVGVDLAPSTATPTLFGPFVSAVVNPVSINNGGTGVVTVSLNNVPQEGYSSAEFTCFYDQSLLEVSNITVTDLFGADAVTAVNSAQYNRFIVAIAGSHGNKATMSGVVFTFSVKGLQVVQTQVGCEARVSKGDNALTPISSAPAGITIVGSTTSTPTPNLTPGTSTVLPSTCDRAEFIADINIPPGTVISPGSTFTKTWRLKNLGPCDWTTSYYQLVFFYGEQMGAPSSLALPASVSAGETVDISLQMTAPNASGSYRGYWMFRNSSGANFGIGPDANQPWFVDINVSGPTLPPSPTFTRPAPSQTPTATLGVPTNTPTPTITPGGPTTTPAGNWSTFTNLKYAFQFAYPPDSQIAAGNTDNDTRINLPFASGTNFQTNLQEKYVEVIVEENQNPCVVSPIVGESSTQPENMTINNIQFSALTGSEVAAGNRYDWVSYATTRDNACISLAFILHSVDPGNYQTPPPVFDKASESTVFAQIMSTYAWLASPATITPTISPTSSPTGMISGQVIASKPVTISVYGADHALIASVQASLNNSFAVTLSGGTYTAVASAGGFLSAEGSFSVTSNLNSTLPTIALNAGDIDNNNVIDQFDALTIGMSYNASTPAAADLNNDGIINVLDLELLAQNYRKTGPVVWQ